MTCPHCGAQWKLPNNAFVEQCPFCQGDMYTPDQNLTTIESVFKEILSRFGTQALEDGNVLKLLFSRLAPTLKKEAHLLSFFIECGCHSSLLQLSNATPSEQKLGYEACIQQMTDWAKEVSDGFLAAINLQPLVKNQVVPEYDYVDLGEGKIELCFCKGPLQKQIKFPKTVEGKQVISIAGSIFGTAKAKDSERNNVESIYIPEGVTTIGNGAFYGCKSLNRIVLPQSLTDIGEYVFRSCKALSNVDLPANLTAIGKGAFAGSNISSISLPDQLISISAECFKNCKCLSNVSFPSSLEAIEDEAFAGCRSIGSVVLPENVTRIGYKAFEGCKGLTKVTLSNRLAVLSLYAFANCEAMTTINLPDSISVIEDAVFSRCFALTDVVLPSRITSVSCSCFESCKSLTAISIPDGATAINADAFRMCSRLKAIFIPSSVTSIADDAFSYCKGVVIHCLKDSYAYAFAKKRNWKVQLL